MRIDILTLFPESLLAATSSSIINIAKEKKLVDINLVNIRDFTRDKHKKVDDAPYGGGSGMVMQCQPIIDAHKHALKKRSKRVLTLLLSPRGEKYTQEMAVRFSKFQSVIIICGHYEGIDERVSELIKPIEISIGDFILTGGEPAAWVVIDSIIRLIPGVLGDPGSLDNETFNNHLLEAPQYTRPADFNGLKAPDVLLSGNHSAISRWKQERSEAITKKRRPDLYRLYNNKKYK